jgi:hypothetical protein
MAMTESWLLKFKVANNKTCHEEHEESQRFDSLATLTRWEKQS